VIASRSGEHVTWTLSFIGLCWAGWLAYWLAMAFANKRTVERAGFVGYRVVAIVAFAACAVVGRALNVSAQSRAWHTPLALALACDAIVVAGLAFTVWARIVLGRNWSAEVTFKEGHELIETGPYRLVRHPIYTGLIAMALGTTLAYGRAVGFALLVALCAALWSKARTEERVMIEHFADSYAEYRRRTHAIVPFVL
jgi:protein-S-isoprenylcysteine O-methyltransferase Ste14